MSRIGVARLVGREHGIQVIVLPKREESKEVRTCKKDCRKSSLALAWSDLGKGSHPHPHPHPLFARALSVGIWFLWSRSSTGSTASNAETGWLVVDIPKRVILDLILLLALTLALQLGGVVSNCCRS